MHQENISVARQGSKCDFFQSDHLATETGCMTAKHKCHLIFLVGIATKMALAKTVIQIICVMLLKMPCGKNLILILLSQSSMSILVTNQA